MQYRNRGQRCKHGFMVGVVTCPVCQPPKYTRWKTIHSEGGHVVNNNRIGRPRLVQLDPGVNQYGIRVGRKGC